MSLKTIKKVKFGNAERMSFAQVDEIIQMPYLIDAQKASYKNFVSKGIGEVFKEFSPITDSANRIELHFIDYRLEGMPKYTERECKERDETYAVPMRVTVRLVKTQTGEAIDQEVYLGEFPLMTPKGSFIYNGAERVVVSQLVRSPGVSFKFSKDVKSGRDRVNSTMIPYRGSWIEFNEDDKNVLWVQAESKRKIQATVLLRALSSIINDPRFLENEKRNWINTGLKFATDEEIAALFGKDELITNTLDKDLVKSPDEAVIELNRKIRPGEVPNVDSIRVFLENLFFDRRKYELTRVGRNKFNKKLSLAARIANRVAAHDVIDFDGVVLAKKGDIINEALAKKIQNSGLNEVKIFTNKEGESETILNVFGNAHVDLANFTKIDVSSLGINEMVYYPVLKHLLAQSGGSDEKLRKLVIENYDKLIVKHILIEDIIATINYILCVKQGVGFVDEIDHLGNRRVRCVGELLQHNFRIGMTRLERAIRDKIQVVQNESETTPQSLVNSRQITGAIREFFGSSQLSQFMEELNPIAELTNKRKLSALGPGGLNRERAGLEVRDVHYTHYSRLCPIETPEGQNIGLISSLSSFARINEYGFIEAPYRKVDKKAGRVTEEVEYLTADLEDRYAIAQATEPRDEKGYLTNDRILARHLEDISERSKHDVDYIDVSPKQMFSVATALIPFLENDATTRALMGSNMQRQAVPLIKPESPIVGTGIEHKIAYDSGVMVIANNAGVVTYVDADNIVVQEEDGKSYNYALKKFIGTNQYSCINQHPIVSKGDRVEKGQIMADGQSTDNGELALGKNVLIGFMSWEGYNYEDAILVSEKIVKDDVFTSIHIAKLELEARETKLGLEEITRDIPNVGDDALKHLDENGVIRVGAEVKSGDILIGKVTPKGETELTPEERLLRAIFGEKAREVRDTSLRVPNGEGGIVVDVKTFTRENKGEMKPGVHELVRVYIAQKRKISVGDKMAGRHGNKGVISRILPEEDMPFMADGTPLQIVLNPLGVPSRMNIGQVLEVHLGLVAKALGCKFATPVFDGASEADIKKLLADNNFVNDGKVDGKVKMYDGRTGEEFENRATVGYMYMIKLNHLVDDKIHARSTGPYSLVTQQPLGGKAQFGGQRFGEMEVWALYAYGAANILQEIITVKSDDVVGRVKTYESIVKGLNVSEPGIPESFKVLVKELQALSLDIKVLTEDRHEIGIASFIEHEGEEMKEGKGRKGRYEDSKESQTDIDIAGDINLFDDNLGDDDDDLLDDDAADVNMEGDDLLSSDNGLGDIADPFADRILEDDDLDDL